MNIRLNNSFFSANLISSLIFLTISPVFPPNKKAKSDQDWSEYDERLCMYMYDSTIAEIF